MTQWNFIKIVSAIDYGQSIEIYSIFFTFEWVSEWLLLSANSAIFQLYHGENKLIFNEMIMRSALF
jgi:hypothetical protein